MVKKLKLRDTKMKGCQWEWLNTEGVDGVSNVGRQCAVMVMFCVKKGRDRREGSVGRPSHMKEVEVVGNGRTLGGCLREFVDGGELMS
jgi:hypothetical protein